MVKMLIAKQAFAKIFANFLRMFRNFFEFFVGYNRRPGYFTAAVAVAEAAAAARGWHRFRGQSTRRRCCLKTDVQRYSLSNSGYPRSCVYVATSVITIPPNLTEFLALLALQMCALRGGII